MIIKKYRNKPYDLIQHERLLKRIPQNHPQYSEIEKQIRILASGYYGEKSLDYHISNIPHDNLFVFQDLRLPHLHNTFFQMDFLLLTQEALVILDSKYLRGKIEISEYQMVQNVEGSIQSYKNPIDQVQNQLYKLRNLLHKYSFPISPNYSFVVFSNSNSILEISPDYSYSKRYILRPEQIRQRISEFYERCITNYYSSEKMNELSELLLSLHTPREDNILKKYKIDCTEIRKGVFCPKCNQVLEKEHVWLCKYCGKVNQLLYLETMLDYYYIVGDKITIKTFMDFFNISSRFTAYRILNTNKFIEVFNEGTRKYQINLTSLKKEVGEHLYLDF